MKKHIVEVIKAKSLSVNDRLYIDGDLICNDLRQNRQFIKFLLNSGYVLTNTIDSKFDVVEVYEYSRN